MDEILLFFFFKQKTAYEMRISDWSSDVCSSDLHDACVACLGHAQNPSQALASVNTGSAATTPSMRSRMPPWPGISAPESLAPTWRLSMLSNRSPTPEKPADRKSVV